MTGVLKRTPHALLDAVNARLGLENDTVLAKRLGMAPSGISKIRRGHNRVTPEIILRVYDLTGWSIEDIRKLINNYRGY